MTKKNFYTVKKVRKPGIYQTWNQTKAQVSFVNHLLNKTIDRMEKEYIRKHRGY